MRAWRASYYADKMGQTTLEAATVTQLAHNYLEGVMWVLEYYYRGVVSWTWFYPYHYAPMASDMKSLRSFQPRCVPTLCLVPTGLMGWGASVLRCVHFQPVSVLTSHHSISQVPVREAVPALPPADGGATAGVHATHPAGAAPADAGERIAHPGLLPAGVRPGRGTLARRDTQVWPRERRGGCGLRE